LSNHVRFVFLRGIVMNCRVSKEVG
jgi:hypothetical protein